jgi:hypothetical protein
MESLLLVVMVVTLVLGVAMIVFAWRVLRRDRTRADARVAHLRTLAADPDPEPEWPDRDVFREEPDPMEVSYEVPTLFGATAAGPATAAVPSRRWGTVALVVLIFMGAGAGTVYALLGSDHGLSWPRLGSGPAVTPLELLSLGHRREAGGDFIVTGLVQNPSAGHTAPALVAVVYLFDGSDQYFASGTAAIDVPALGPGDQSPFTIRLQKIGTVSRYRLGFRRTDGGVFAHVDRRGEPLAGTTTALVEEAR